MNVVKNDTKLEIKKIKRDMYGYLKSFKDWNIKVALELAKEENIIMTKNHWEIIFFLRDFYFEYHIVPPVRLLVEAIKKKHGTKKGNSFYLFKLFNQGPSKQASKIAGLPKPVQCL